MNVHKNARLTPRGRAVLVDRIENEGWRVRRAAEAAGVSVRTAYRWLGRHRLGGERRLHDRSSAPRRCPRKTPDALVAQIEAPKPPVVRYERNLPGELVHLDIKKLGRFDVEGHRVTGDRRKGCSRHAGWDFLHVCIDDASRLAYTEILPSERKEDTTAFLQRALAWLARHGVGVQRVMTDNGSAYRSGLFRNAVADAGARHIRTRPYTPKTNGKAERFIQTSLREWAYARAYASSAQRAASIGPWTDAYNLARPHSGIAGLTPWQRVNNLLGNDT